MFLFIILLLFFKPIIGNISIEDYILEPEKY